MIRKWKIYPIHEPLILPKEAEIIHVGNQLGMPTVWTTDVDDLEAGKRRAYRIQIFATGETPPAGSSHVGSVQMGNGLVWHVFRLVGEVGDGLDDSE